MRWWQGLRQAYPRRSAITLAIAVLAVCVVVGGVVIGASAATLHATSSDAFCSTACHELRDNAAAEFKGTVHDVNRTGVRVGCPDCHLPKEFVPMMIRKMEAAREVWGHFTGVIDTKEKYEKERYRMAVHEWKRMKANGGQECKNCHNFDSMDADKQSDTARDRHAKAKAANTVCIDCHFGIAHNEPDGPGPAELKN